MPSIDPRTGMCVHEPGSFAQSCPWALDYLTSRGIRVHPTSAFAEAIARALACSPDEVRKFPSRFHALKEAADIAGTNFITKALHRAVETGLAPYTPPTWLLSDLAVSQFNVLQAGHESKKERNRVWELVIGALAARCATDIVHEDRDEPDIACTFEGQRIHIAAKMAYSDKRLWINVGQGRKQSLATECDVDLVYVNVVELLREKNQEWFDKCRLIDFQHNEDCVEWAKAETTEWSERREMRELAAEIQEDIKRPVHVCFFMPLMLWFRGSFTPFFYSNMPIYTDHPSSDFVVRMLESCNTTLGAVGTKATS